MNTKIFLILIFLAQTGLYAQETNKPYYFAFALNDSSKILYISRVIQMQLVYDIRLNVNTQVVKNYDPKYVFQDTVTQGFKRQYLYHLCNYLKCDCSDYFQIKNCTHINDSSFSVKFTIEKKELEAYKKEIKKKFSNQKYIIKELKDFAFD